MRVVSLVPSLTETLIECGVNVVGRSRFCIHPAHVVRDIPIVGGTKHVDWNKVAPLHADVILMDREENTKEMAESSPLPVIATHVTSLDSLRDELFNLGRSLHSEKLGTLGREIEHLENKKVKLPVITSLIPPPQKIENILYMIWKNPWMAVSLDTFIGSVTAKMGHVLPDFDTKYPTIDLKTYDPKSTLLLFSSEPFPFEKHEAEILKLGFPSAIIDGENYSWFGVRSIRFLQNALKG